MKKDYIIYLGVGVVAIVILVGVYLFQSKKTASVVSTPQTPITSLLCESAFFNTVVGKPEVIVAAQGVATTATTSVSCVFNYTDPEGETTQSTVSGQLTDAAGGKTWRCNEEPKEFPQGSTDFNVTVTDNNSATSSCESTVYLP